MPKTWKRRLFIAVAVLLSLLAVGVTSHTGHEAGLTDYLGAFTGLATGLALVSLSALIWYAFDLWLLPEIDTMEEIKNGNSQVTALVIAFLLAFVLGAVLSHASYGQSAETLHHMPQQSVIDSARADLYKTEVPPGSNAGPLPEACLKVVGLGPGYPYCAACLSKWAEEAGAGWPKRPDGTPIRSAATSDFRGAKCAIPPLLVAQGKVRPRPGSYWIWQKGNGAYGHGEVMLSDADGKNPLDGGPYEPLVGRCAYTIGANTTPGPSAPEADRTGGSEGGVYPRVRCLNLSSYFHVEVIILARCMEKEQP